MKIIKLNNAILLLRVKPNQDKVKCHFWFFVSWNCFVIESVTHDLKVLNISQVKEFYTKLANDYNRKYRIN